MADDARELPIRRGDGPQDLEIVRSALAGDGAAVDELVERLRCLPRMVAAQNASLGRPLSDQELEDVAQNAIGAVWAKLRRYDGRVRLETWVWRFGYLELLYALRKLRRAPRTLPDDAQARPGPDELSCFEFEGLYATLDRLDPVDLSLIQLKSFEELTFEEISSRLGIPVNTAKTRYYRILQKLRARLERSREPAEGRRPS